MQIEQDNRKFQVSLDERIRQVRRQLTDKERTERFYYSRDQKWTQEKVSTGELILRVTELERRNLSKEWRETIEDPIEGKLGDVLAQIAGLFEEFRLRLQREAEERTRQWKIEEERRRKEMDAKREKIRVRRLIGYSEDWRVASDIRAFIAAVEKGPLAAGNTERFERWKSWALGHADDLDPLTSEDLFDQTVNDYEVYASHD